MEKIQSIFLICPPPSCFLSDASVQMKLYEHYIIMLQPGTCIVYGQTII